MATVPAESAGSLLPQSAGSSAAIRDALPAGLAEQLREAQRERWRAEVRRQAALDQLRFFETKSGMLEEQVEAMREQVAELNERIESMINSRAWQTIVGFWRLKRALRLRRR
jgi:hypothetical protein